MGSIRSKFRAVKKPDRGYQLFLEKFKNVHSYIDERDVGQYATMTWEAMSPWQKTQFLNFQNPALTPKKRVKRRKSVAPERPTAGQPGLLQQENNLANDLVSRRQQKPTK
ncbi:hypothetical protein AWZ03_012335 [Drosophila navojoa]|uniref:Uncharacterized protein n=1 Tax=Drosophila navojoa TaxID=7232 RepID=A0A484B071_DRONA|nr:hypothetical protein AWZ03_012335 [Drosophila navojoa]